MFRARLALSLVATIAALVLAGRMAAAAPPAHGGPRAAVSAAQQTAPSTGAQQAQAAPGAAQDEWVPGEAKLRDVRPKFPSGSPAVHVLVRAEVAPTGVVGNATVVGGPADLGEIAAAAVKQWRFAKTSTPRSVLIGFNPSAPNDSGGPVRAEKAGTPVKTHDVRPVYPEDALRADVHGAVVVETRIASDGTVSDAWVVRSVPQLDAAAVEAVLGWKFEPPAFPLEFSVTINFTTH